MTTKLHTPWLIALLTSATTFAAPSVGQTTAPPTPSCTAASGDTKALLEHAAAVTGLTAARGRALHSQGYDIVSFDYQSDRPYQPYLSAISTFDSWFQPQTGVERSEGRMFVAGND